MRTQEQNEPQGEWRKHLSERTDLLADELLSALQWQRPSILLAIYTSERVRNAAETILEERLRRAKQTVVRLSISEELFDITRAILPYLTQHSIVFFISGLRWGGGKKGLNAYRALNLHREFFVENHLRAIFWLLRSEVATLARFAPDFWAFRHQTVDFTDIPLANGDSQTFPVMEESTPSKMQSAEDMEAAIMLRQKALAELPPGPPSQSTRLTLLYELASLYREQGNYRRAYNIYREGLQINKAVENRSLDSPLWTGLGLVAEGMGKRNRAKAAYRNALKKDPANVISASRLASLERDQGRPAEALAICTKALELHPEEAELWSALGSIYYKIGQMEDARLALQKSARLAPANASHWKNLGRVYHDLGRWQEALRALRKASRLAPQDRGVWHELGNIYQRLGRLQEADKAYQTALSLRSHSDTD